jgi:hypothetical protein
MLFEQLGHVAADAAPEILEFMLFILLMINEKIQKCSFGCSLKKSRILASSLAEHYHVFT